jgi:hypothetical protein
MRSIDYSSASLHAKLSLKGKSVDALWDASLRFEMESANRAIHEEQVLQELLLDLEFHESTSAVLYKVRIPAARVDLELSVISC